MHVHIFNIRYFCTFKFTCTIPLTSLQSRVHLSRVDFCYLILILFLIPYFYLVQAIMRTSFVICKWLVRRLGRRSLKLSLCLLLL